MTTRQILLKYDELEYWRINDLKHKLSLRLGRNVTMKEFVYSAITGKYLKSAQELIEEADRIYCKEMKKHYGKD